jgi:SAM-dependent methyltransferase
MNIDKVLSSVAASYPASQIEHQRRDIPRIVFHLSLLADRIPAGGTIADIGGGLGLFSPGCAALGFNSILVDDFRDRGNIEIAGDVFRRVHERYGVTIVSRDVVAEGVDFEGSTLDAVTTFDSIEHWHHSPKHALHQLMAALKPNGLLIIGVPNCVNFHKRISVPLGFGKWSQMADWYEEETFRGHVREPDAEDLRYIARDLGLTNVRIIGRNWLGYDSRSAWVRRLMPVVDQSLRLIPSFCSNLYLIGRKTCGQGVVATRRLHHGVGDPLQRGGTPATSPAQLFRRRLSRIGTEFVDIRTRA